MNAVNQNIARPPEVGPQKAYQGGIAGALSIITLWALGRVFGIVEIPEMGVVAEAITVLVGAAVAGAGIAWRTWIVPNLPKLVMAMILFPLAVACAPVSEWLDEMTGTSIEERCHTRRTVVAGYDALQRELTPTEAEIRTAYQIYIDSVCTPPAVPTS